MKHILDFIFSRKFRTVSFFILFTVLMTAAISSQNFFFQKIIENNMALKDVIAEKDVKVIDTIKTEQHRKEVVQNVEPILTQAEDEFITTSLTALKNSIMKIRKKTISDQIKIEELGVLFDTSDRKYLVDFMLRASDDDLQYIFDKSMITLTSVLNKGVSYKDFDNNNVSEIIHKNIPINVTRHYSSIIVGVLNQVIVPNLVIDEYATEIAKKNVQDAIKPYEVVFKKGQPIILQDEPVNKLKRDALRAAGYNVLQFNFSGILGIFLLIGFFTFVFLYNNFVYLCFLI